MYEAITITTTRTIRILYPHFSQMPNADGWQSWQNSDLQILQSLNGCVPNASHSTS
jgi:hypothetical protein